VRTLDSASLERQKEMKKMKQDIGNGGGACVILVLPAGKKKTKCVHERENLEHEVAVGNPKTEYRAGEGGRSAVRTVRANPALGSKKVHRRMGDQHDRALSRRG